MAGIFAVLASLLGTPAALSALPPSLTVVELFQSQGCSSCPPANANVMALADRSDLIVLSYGVTYWDHLGWKDSFASEAGTARQWAYARGLHHDNVFTPQVVVNGERDVVGVDKAVLDRTVNAAPRPPNAPALVLGKGSVSVGASPAGRGGADLWLVRYDPRIVRVAIKRGENSGKTLPHRNVVRALVRLGRWTGSAQTYGVPPSRDDALRTVVLLQASNGGAILAAVKA